MTVIFPIWLLLAAIFSYLAYMQWRLSQESLRTFVFRDREEGEENQEGSQELTRETVQEFDSYLEMLNYRNQKHNQMAAIGFFVAVFLSLVSMFMVVGRF